MPRISWGSVSAWLVACGLFESEPIASAPSDKHVLNTKAKAQKSAA